VDVGSTLIADSQTAGLPVPGQCALHHPAVTSQLRAAFNPTLGDARLNVALAQSAPTATVIISLVGVQFVGTPAPWSPTLPDGKDSIDERLQHAAVMHGGAGVPQGKRSAVRIREDVALRACLAAVGRVRAGCRAPFSAA
jgi:hypothetical protein